MDIGYTGAFLGGILTLLSPCSVMLLPAFFAYAFASPTKLLGRTALFYAGLLTTLVPLGLLAGLLGSLVLQNRTALISVAAGVVIVIGILQLVGVEFPGLSRRAGTDGTSAVSVFVLGSVYGVAGVCAGPILGSVLAVAATGGNPLYGGIMLAIFALGMALPLLLLSLLWTRLGLGTRGWLKPRRFRIGPWENSIWMAISGLLSIGIGVLLLATQGTSSLGGALTIDAQFEAESAVVSFAAGISNMWFAGAALVLLLLAGGLYWWRSRRAESAASPAPAQERP
ncbi:MULTISPECIES: cytochrome c biogenesis CcdA family protein [Arthrobacter]|uniref:Cytochrome C biogenesis protein CcdA n=1 Tax=Arthrobacter psychrochitiniphilus TaxID=291045 RepID=A0A2V3DXZ9_9MICC|nr:cytochrome c biogenesis CcdA family protein [Arthrobacter psychrochitiniphilus]NYG16406.1 cytochrome c biogenesis protein CcdA [Arthrobacter psychrochitiniphilus]PXA69442.1 cytochrome C biogenesis protein CcdA [Arthrobacter psychrochitiniphilus]